MNGSVAVNAESHEVVIRVLALLAAMPDVMDFEFGQRTTLLASPAISRQDLPVQGPIRVRL